MITVKLKNFALLTIGLCIRTFMALLNGLILLFSPPKVAGNKLHAHSRGRIAFSASCALLLFMAVAGKIFITAYNGEYNKTVLTGTVQTIASRADIVDRMGHVLATNIETHSLYAHPNQMVNPEKAIAALMEIFPAIDEDKLRRELVPTRKFAWVRHRVSPEQMEAVHNIGEPGLLFGTREMRFYPNENLAAHVLGGYRFGTQGVHSAEILGIAGVEGYFNDTLNDPAQEGPLRLTIDLPTQNAIEDVLTGGMQMLGAKGASAVVMDVHSGKIRALASLPDFNPNNRPIPLLKGDPGDSPIFNRAVQGVYELGSVFKVFTIAQALDLRIVSPSTMVDTRSPMRVGRFNIRDFHNYGPSLSVTDVLVESSNVGTARLANMITAKRQEEFMGQLGMLISSPVELLEAKRARPIVPPRWTDISSMTISYGHGLSVSPLHLAAGYATVLGGGTRVQPTLVEDSQETADTQGERVVSEQTSQRMRTMLRAVVTEGTASFARETGYSIGGKTGTADKAKPGGGGYFKDRVISTFAAAVPAENPEYIVVITFDEPVDYTLGSPMRTAGWTAVPVSGEAIRRIGPLLGITYTPEPVKKKR
jgi:cell division protein FtsI (penicillin-binding protein 3)